MSAEQDVGTLSPSMAPWGSAFCASCTALHWNILVRHTPNLLLVRVTGGHSALTEGRKSPWGRCAGAGTSASLHVADIAGSFFLSKLGKCVLQNCVKLTF